MLLMILCTALVLVVSFVLHLMRWPSYRTFRLLANVPGPKGLPFLGMAHKISMVSEEEFLEYICRMCNEYPRVMKYWIMGLPNVFLSQPEDLETVMGSSVHIKKGEEYNFLEPWLKEGLLVSTGSKWHSRRKMLTPAFHFRILEDSLQTFNRSSLKLVDELLEANEKPVDIEEYIRHCTLTALCESAMGICLDKEPGKGYGYVHAIIRISEILKKRMLSFWMFKDWMFHLQPAGFEFRRLLKTLKIFTGKVIDDRKKMYLQSIQSPEKEQSKSRKAFLDSLIDYEYKNPGSLSKSDIMEEVDTFMFEGHDTTSSAVTFSLFIIGTHLDVQEKIAAELFDIFGDSDRNVEMKDLKRMEYLDKVIKETMRIYPSVPHISRMLTNDLKLDDDLTIPAGANVSIFIYNINRNPRYFPDPEKFDTERFADDEVQKRHPFAYIPFSAGPRNCIGQKFAMMELKVILSTILRKLHVETITKREDFKLLSLLILRSNIPIMIKFKRRIIAS